ncbi:MAG: F0F1 ATP synthase subunit A, partial [Bacteroidota bacterium]
YLRFFKQMNLGPSVSSPSLSSSRALVTFMESLVSVLFTIVIFILEMIVAIVQPFIFTLLTAVFIGMAMESHDDHH